nr:unnamed protein product [Spirometra erinaceieuropaei]
MFNVNDECINFTEDEAEKLAVLDSLEFGFLRSESSDIRPLLEKAVFCFDSIIAQTVYKLEQARAAEEQTVLAKLEAENDPTSVTEIRLRIYNKYVACLEKRINPRIYLYLGHYQLLLNFYDDALSAYLKYESLADEEAKKDVAFLYGLALCCFHFNAFNRVIKLSQQILYLQPNFPRRKEVHIRLGYIYKLRKELDKSIKNFRQALTDTSPGTWGPLEIRFQIGHLLEVCGKSKPAKAAYEQILEAAKSENSLVVRHLCLRQLAWLYQTGSPSPKPPGQNEDNTQDRDLAVQLLQQALELDSSNGKTWYLLGRCQAAVNRVQEAFSAYRSSIDKTEASADTWCSIGVLYQEQNQPMDALQAYFCAVQLDKCHVTAWVNLGTLYESMHQYKEALKCYSNAVNADKHNQIKPQVKNRLATLQQLLSRLPEKVLSICGADSASGGPCAGGTPGSSPSKLPTVDDAWKLPIPFELTQRQMQFMLQEASRSQCSAFSQQQQANGEAGGAGRWSALLSANYNRQRQQQQQLSHVTVKPEEEKVAREVNGDPSAGDGDGEVEQEAEEATDDVTVMTDGADATASEDQDLKRTANSPPVSPPSSSDLMTLRSLLTRGNDLSAQQRRQLADLQAKGLRFLAHRKRHPEEAETELEETSAVTTGHRHSRRRHLRGSATALLSLKSADLAAAAVAAPPVAVAAPESTQPPVAVGTTSQAGPVGGGSPDRQNAVDLFAGEDLPNEEVEDGLCAGQLPDEDLAFLTDDILAQLNGPESSANLDLMEMALFSASNDQQRPPSSVGSVPSQPRSCGPSAASIPSAADTAAGPTDTGDETAPTAGGGAAVIKCDDLRLTNSPGAAPTELHSIDTDVPSKMVTETPAPASESPKLVTVKALLTRPLVIPESPTALLDISLSAKQIVDAVSGLGRLWGGPRWCSLLPEGSPLPTAPEKPYPPPATNVESSLFPPTPCVYLNNRKDATSPELARYCLSQPVVVIRGLAACLRLDLGLFSTKSLVEANPDQKIEVRTQKLQPPDENKNASGETAWFVESPRSLSTIAKFAAYQATSFTEALRDEKLANAGPGSGVGSGVSTPLTAANRPPVGGVGEAGITGLKRDAEGTVLPSSSTGMSEDLKRPHPHTGPTTTPDSTSKVKASQSGQKRLGVGGNGGAGGGECTQFRNKVIRFGTNCDLSDERKWFPQLHELTKLPTFFRVTSASNMLSHVGYPLLGMNTVQLYMKVPGSRTPGHQENNCFCSVNINIGPGDCEWFAVPEQYWGAVYHLAELHGVDYFTGAWWPDLEELRRERIPLYRFIQRPGDLVWINSGTVHWVQAIGWCNNIAYNVGPLTARQYQLALERYEFNRLCGVKSIVPLMHLSWQIAKNMKVADRNFFELVRHTLMRTIIDSLLTQDFLEQLAIPVKRHGKQLDDIAHSCHDCEIEVFNFLFVTAQDKKFFVRCLHCARRIDPELRSFTVLFEYYISELSEIYDNFQLRTQPITAFSVGK